MAGSIYGIAALERAIAVAARGGSALDVGCGSSGRLVRVLRKHGYSVEGLDISEEMIALARQLTPKVTFHVGDIRTWRFPRTYDLIVAWDSTFHLPLESQAPVLARICAGLAPGGVLLFTCGGDLAGNVASGSFDGEYFEYSTLGTRDTLALLHASGCACLHLEYDQGPENHVTVIAQRDA
jgi:SAM-dependent methyltransferase